VWWQEAERNRVLPLLGGLAVMYGDLPPLPTTARCTFKGDVQNIQRGMVPRIFGRSYAIEARLHVPDGGAQRVIVANADFMGGFALWVDGQRRLHHTYSFLGVETYRQVSAEPIPTGDVKVRMQFETEAPVVGSVGRVTLWADDRLIGEGELPQTVSLAFTSYAGMDVGCDKAWSSTAATRTRRPTRSPEPSKRSSSTSSQFTLKPKKRCTSTHRSKLSDRARRAEQGRQANSPASSA
jgi:hypothetical protein